MWQDAFVKLLVEFAEYDHSSIISSRRTAQSILFVSRHDYFPRLR